MLVDGESGQLTRKCIEMAKAGDTVAMRLCLERILPPRRDRPMHITLPTLTSASDATAAIAAITAAVAEGEITPGEGADLNTVVGGFIKAVELTDIEVRLAALEMKAKGR
jgi:hypothetical protein